MSWTNIIKFDENSLGYEECHMCGRDVASHELRTLRHKNPKTAEWIDKNKLLNVNSSAKQDSPKGVRICEECLDDLRNNLDSKGNIINE